MPASMFWVPHIAPGEVDLVGERMGTGEGHEHLSSSHAELCSKYWCLRESRDTQLPAGPASILRKILLSVQERRKYFSDQALFLKSPLRRGCNKLARAPGWVREERMDW